MLDIKQVCDDPDFFDKALNSRFINPVSQTLFQLDQKRCQVVTLLQELQEKRNRLSKEIGQHIAAGQKDAVTAIKEEIVSIKKKLLYLQIDEKNISTQIFKTLIEIPNIPMPDVPIGKDETSNVELYRFGALPKFDFLPKEHFKLGEMLNMFHPEKAAQISGSRFMILSGKLASLERALGQFMIDLHVREHGYKEISVPVLVKKEALFGTAQLPKFSEDLFKTTDERWLISTSEISLTNLVREEILNATQLPIRVTALTPCFRSEAGAAGRDTRGMFRQHQFNKVEMVSITDSKSSLDELERMTQCAENILKKLSLPYRKILLCSGDMGFSARKTYDLEVWLPSQNSYKEISSCSVCGDFQARRMNARYREDGHKKLQYVHTLNGSGLAVGRTLIAILENYQQSDGSVVIPEALRPYLSGLEKIEKE